jgi:hypothetical protein
MGAQILMLPRPVAFRTVRLEKGKVCGSGGMMLGGLDDLGRGYILLQKHNTAL